MHSKSIAPWQHTHIFGQDQMRSGERRTLIVVILTAAMMIVEIIAGILVGSMALLADGIHMGSHMVGLLISLIAYIYARRYANDDRFSFGTGKVNSLAGYTSAILLFMFALVMGYESLMRLFHPVGINYNTAILVAVLGLAVNGTSMLILGQHGGAHEHNHGYAPAPRYSHSETDHDHHSPEDHHSHGTRNDHNLTSAYLHVFADAMTSVFAIFALMSAKYIGWNWADPLMGMVGAFLVARWSFSLMMNAGKVLLDHQSPQQVRQRIKSIVEGYKDTRVTDLHLWCIGPGIYSANLSVVSKYPDSPEKYKTLIPRDTGVVHATVEVHACPD